MSRDERWFGPYRLEEAIGAGGMGAVYRARDTRLNRDVAIKICGDKFGPRFEREAKMIAALNHPNICQVYDVGPNFLVMELVEGETLRSRFKRGADVTIDIARQILEALRAAHRAGIVHRDLKPENIMIRFDGYVKVLDFGLAKLINLPSQTATEDVATAALSVEGQILGTASYMSPEQILGRDTGATSDLFAFGIILHEILTGKHPWPRESAIDTLHAILHDDPAPLNQAGADGDLAAVVQKLLRKSPAERYPSAEAVLEALTNGTRSQERLDAAGSNSKALMSIAVLPFVFLSDLERSKELSLGFADALITTLGSLEDISVLPTSAILNYSAGADPAVVCRDLGVRYTLQGNVQKSGAQWRVSMQLFDSKTQAISLSEKHDFRLESVFDVQDEIGRRTIESLQSRVASDLPRSRNRYSSEPDAYDEFMTGLRDSYSDNRQKIESAVNHLSQAIKHDPNFALAHAILSQMCMNMYNYFDPQRSWLEMAENHCRKALTLDRALPEGHMARAWILWSPAKNFQHAEAIAALEQALTLQPNLERAHNRMSSICWHIGRIQEALTAHELAQRSNPKTVSSNLTSCYLLGGQFDRAEEEAQAWLLKSPANVYALRYLAICSMVKGDLDAADRWLASAFQKTPDESLLISLQGLLKARRNLTDAAMECVRKALDSPRSFGHTHHTYYQISCIYAVLGETDKAMAWLARTADTGFPCWSFFRIDPFLETLRDKPDFQALMETLELKYKALEIRKL